MRAPPAFLVAIAGLVVGAGVIALLPERTLFVASSAHDHGAESAGGERWACPMMDFIGNRPGNCPVCGMKMTKVTAGELTREQQRRMDVELVTVTEGPARALIRAYGAVRYDDRTLQVVIPRVSGRIVKRHPAARHMGTLVNAGDPIVDLYSPEVFAAQGELAAAVKLGDQPTIGALRDRFGRWNLAAVAKAIIEGGAPVDTVTITSPFAGRVVLALEGETEAMSARLPQVGQEVMADAPLLRLVEPSAYMLVVHVPETRAHWLRVDQPVRLASDDRGELSDIAAAISWVAPELNLEIRAREVHIHLRDPKGRLLPGSLVNARFETALTAELDVADATKPDTWGKFVLVPKSAILSTGVRNVAWRVAGRQADGRIRFELAPVALGPRIEDESGNDRFVVRAGLKPGDEVAAQGVFLIDSQAQLAGTPSLLFPNGAVAPAPAHQH
ncbi:efflux RND transporter periplasmic adaptor subunit [Horticoccus sp. 23ND18S-11]|uniref:efflux RND transporter periplasmic adaptor subunit n=1 Tax=Horticoccus sp. 23ND18S-11 TaxID=3391832 RepID=UPI0039C8D7B1